MPNNIIKPKTIQELKDRIMQSGTGFEAKYILEKAEKELSDLNGQRKLVGSKTFLYKSMTLFEFDKGVLMLNGISELYRIFALEFSKNLQAEYNCKAPSEKSMAEIISLNFVRVLETQRRISNILDKVTTRYDVQFLAVLSKELDRAERHYLTSLQVLKMLKMPPLGVNIKTQMAVVGQNQVVQAKNQNDKTI